MRGAIRGWLEEETSGSTRAGSDTQSHELKQQGGKPATMSRKNNRNKIKAQYELEVVKEKERKEKLQMKRERKSKKDSTMVVKKVSNKVLRRMKIRKQEQEAKGEVKAAKPEKMDTKE